MLYINPDGTQKATIFILENCIKKINKKVGVATETNGLLLHWSFHLYFLSAFAPQTH